MGKAPGAAAAKSKRYGSLELQCLLPVEFFRFIAPLLQQSHLAKGMNAADLNAIEINAAGRGFAGRQ